MRKPRKPKLRKLPKKPKRSSSIDTWKRYEQRASAVVSENNKRVSDYNKKLRDWKSRHNAKDRIARKFDQKHSVKYAM